MNKIAGAEGRCLSTCLPAIASEAELLPQSVCPTGTRCAPCYNPTAADPIVSRLFWAAGYFAPCDQIAQL